MKALLKMGRSGLHLLIDLADYPQRSVRRRALDGLCAAGPAVVPVLFEALERKPSWHYLRNMLVILGKVEAGGPKVEGVFRQALEHPEAVIRKEALPGVARLLRENAAELVAGCLDDPDLEVRRRAVACLGMTGITDPRVYERLAALLSSKSADDMALAVVATLNRVRPGERAGAGVEAGLIELVGGGWFGVGKGTADRSLRLEAIRALGQFPSGRARKVLERLLKENDVGVVRAAQEALIANP
jgi:HEAT repeat protein